MHVSDKWLNCLQVSSLATALPPCSQTYIGADEKIFLEFFLDYTNITLDLLKKLGYHSTVHSLFGNGINRST
jgi:hypothetical protein